jgi:hypothetical protein
MGLFIHFDGPGMNASGRALYEHEAGYKWAKYLLDNHGFDNSPQEKWKHDSDIIFTAVSTGDFGNYQEAESAVVALYMPDMSFDRAGISHALKRLAKYYE